jgi:hypothetical protein
MSSGLTGESLADEIYLTGNGVRSRTLDYAIEAIY